MLLNLNSKFKFFLTTTFLFSSPDTLALHLSVSIDDKESSISESLIIKDVISIGVVPFRVMRTELPPEFNGAVNGIPNVTEELPEFNGAVNGIPEVREELPTLTVGVDGMVPPIHKVPVQVDHDKDPVQVDHYPDVSIPDTPVRVSPVVPKDPGKVVVVHPPVNDIPNVTEELPEFNGAVNGIPNVTEELPVVTYVSITAVPANAPIMDKPEYIGVVPSDAPVIDKPEYISVVPGDAPVIDRPEYIGVVPSDAPVTDKPEYIGVIPSDAPVIDKPEYIGVVPSDAPVIDKPEYIGVNSSDLPVTNKTKYVEPRQSLSKLNEENNGILLKHQFNKLRSLQTYCIANKNEFCYGIRHHYMAKNDIHDNLLGLRLGYGITNKLTLGGNIERSLGNNLSNNYRTLHNNIGIGAFVHYKLPSNLYIAASIGKDSNSYQKRSPVLTTALPDVKGVSWNLTLGQDLVLSNKNSLGWYLSYRDTQIKQNGYDVPASQFLMKYNNIKWREHSLASGIKWNYSIATKLTLLNTIEIEHQIKSNIHTNPLQIGNLKYDYYPNIHKTRWSISSGLNYQFSPKFSISFTPYIKNGLISSKQWGTYLSLEGKF